MQDKKVTFIRKNGRVIPIRAKGSAGGSKPSKKKLSKGASKKLGKVNKSISRKKKSKKSKSFWFGTAAAEGLMAGGLAGMVAGGISKGRYGATTSLIGAGVLGLGIGMKHLTKSKGQRTGF